MPMVKENRRETGDAYSFNWSMRIAPDLQMPFDPTHDNMANLKLYPDQPVEVLAADLRRAFSGIVAGNVKEVGIRAIEKFGPYKIHGDPAMMRRMDDLLQGLRGAASYEAAGRHRLHPLLRNLFLSYLLFFSRAAACARAISRPAAFPFSLIYSPVRFPDKSFLL